MKPGYLFAAAALVGTLAHAAPGGADFTIFLQGDHGPVSYRNIVVTAAIP